PVAFSPPLLPRPPRPPLYPYTTLFRSLEVEAAQANIEELEARLEAERIRLEDHTIRSPIDGVIEACRVRGGEAVGTTTELFVVVDRKSTRLNSSHVKISYAVFCLKKKN